MSQLGEGLGETDADGPNITVGGVTLSANERKVVRTPWLGFDAARWCFVLLTQLAAAFFWIAAELSHVPRDTFLILLYVGVGYGVAYLALNSLTRGLSRLSPLEGQRVDWFIDAGGVRRRSPLFDFRIAREGFACVTEDKRRFLFFTSSRAFFVLPKRCLSAEQTRSLRALLATWPTARGRR